MSEEAQRDESLSKRPSNQNMLLIIIIAVMATLLIAGGIGAVLFMRGGSHKTEEPASESTDSGSHDEAASKPKEKEASKDKVKRGDKGSALYVTLDPPFVVNFESTEKARFLQVSVQLMTREEKTAQMLRDNEPIIRNDLLFLFSSQTYETAATASGKEELRKKALETVRNMLKQEGGKPDQLEAIYFTSFVMQ